MKIWTKRVGKDEDLSPPCLFVYNPTASFLLFMFSFK